VAMYLKEKICLAMTFHLANYCPKNSIELLKLSSIKWKDNMDYGIFLLKLDVYAALYEPWILRNLGVFRAIGLLK
jgi:hypothetical protein